eukprot:COSAG06_NODE_14337_length_1165_cov_2.369606_1_plen_88_part_10
MRSSSTVAPPPPPSPSNLPFTIEGALRLFVLEAACRRLVAAAARGLHSSLVLSYSDETSPAGTPPFIARRRSASGNCTSRGPRTGASS